LKVLVAGMDGYLGWSLALHLSKRGHEVAGFDNFSRRSVVAEIGSQSMTPILNMENRLKAAKEVHHFSIGFGRGSTLDYGYLRDVLKEFKPDAIVHLAEQPSAPYSMMDREHAVYTQQNNVIGTLNLLFEMKEFARDAQLVKLGTLGEYGCYDDQTEILTERGWKYFAELTPYDKVATRTTSDRHLAFKKPNSLHSYPFDGFLYHQRSRSLDIMVTPNHRMFTRARSDRKYGPLRLESVDEVKGHTRIYDTGFEWDGESREWFTLPACESLPQVVESRLTQATGLQTVTTVRTGRRPSVTEPKQIPMGVWTRFLGWYLTEGAVYHAKGRPSPYRTDITQRTDTLAPVLEAVKPLCKAIGCKYVVSEYQGGEMAKVIIWGKQLASYLSRFGGAAEKFIPADIKALAPEFLWPMLDSMLRGDGWQHHRGHKYFSISERLADDVQEIALKSGFRAIKSPKDNGFIVSITPNPNVHVNHSKQTDGWAKYQGRVFCVNVGGDGIVYVRRNGRPVWCGNTPNVVIPEGFFEVEYRGRKDTLPFPRQAGSWYHQSKVHDTANIMFACKIWGLRSTDIMQGVVYGTRTPEMTDERLLTRFDFDEAFGTATNRFCAQAAIGYPLSPYGTGHMKRGFIALVDSMQCMTIAIEHPPKEGEYRVFNQLDEVYGVGELATMVAKVAKEKFGLKTEVSNIEDPRMEAQEHFYSVDHQHLNDLGFKPTRTLTEELEIMLRDCLKYKNRIEEKREHIAPTITWREGRRESGPLGHLQVS
jgi:nucleoside-diphosphate-sugar epimerase